MMGLAMVQQGAEAESFAGAGDTSRDSASVSRASHSDEGKGTGAFLTWLL